jgi:hypothetical protein
VHEVDHGGRRTPLGYFLQRGARYSKPLTQSAQLGRYGQSQQTFLPQGCNARLWEYPLSVYFICQRQDIDIAYAPDLLQNRFLRRI